jgi:hypothetical protein
MASGSMWIFSLHASKWINLIHLLFSSFLLKEYVNLLPPAKLPEGHHAKDREVMGSLKL